MNTAAFDDARDLGLLDRTPVQIIEEDFSAFSGLFARLRAEGVADMVEYLADHPRLTREWMALVRLVRVNAPAAQAGGFASPEEMIARFSADAPPPHLEVFNQQVAALWAGRRLFEEEYRYLDAGGKERACLMRCSVADQPGQPGWSRVVLVLVDATGTKRTVAARMEDQDLLRSILARADILLWWAQVRRESGLYRWKINVPSQSFDSPIYRLATAIDKGGLWDNESVPDLAEMTRITEGALNGDAPGYQHEFRVLDAGGGVHWVSEEVGISRLAADEWSLVGVVTDITAQHEAEEGRRESEAQLRDTLSRANCLLWKARVILDQGEMRWGNFDMPKSSMYERLFGAKEIMKGGTLRWWDVLDVPELAEMARRCRETLLSGGLAYEQDFHSILPEGTIWLHEQVAVTPLGPQEWNLVGVVTDVTKQREAEMARTASEAQLRQIMARADCLLWQARVVETGPRVPDLAWTLFIPQSVLYRQLFGRDPVGHPLLDWRELDVPEMEAMHVRGASAMRSGAPGYEQEFRATTREGRTYWLHEQVSIAAAGPHEWMLVGVITDISARREAEAALAAEKERLAVTLSTMSEAVITTDTRGVVQYANRAAVDYLQSDQAALVNQPLADLCTLQDERTAQVIDLPVAQALQEPGLVNLPPHTSLVSRFGTRRLVEGGCATIHGSDGSVAGTVFVFRDVTERERLELEVARSSKLESLGVLAGGIAHDFNNILTAIMGNLALALLDAGEEAKVEQCLREAEQATMRARDLTQQLLTFAKGGDPVRGTVLLPEILREVAQFALHGSRARCEFDLPADLWPADADRGQVGQVVQNLVINAAQAMPEGGIVRIRAENRTIPPRGHPVLVGGSYVRITVADTGTGIRQEHLAKIFDPYFTTKQQGSGLGLATVYSIVKKHKGHVEVQSELGRGTTFHIWLPALRDREASLSSDRPAGLPKMKGRVLLMDDEKIIRQMAGRLLRRLGLEVEVAEDGALAVQKFAAERAAGRPFDVVVMDLTVPGGMGGCEALEQIRRQDAKVKAIVSSGYASDPIMANFRRYGFQGTVAKPYRIEDFARVLHEVLAAAPPG
jgi:signal transduction histidine kinase/CheY-like chemotaxis protein